MSASLPTGQFSRFLLAGGVAALANYGSRFFFSVYCSYPAAIVLAYCIGMLTAFLLMRGYVFDARERNLAPQVAKFALVNALAVIQTLGISMLLVHWVLPTLGIAWQVEAIAHAVGVATPVLTSFILHKRSTFA